MKTKPSVSKHPNNEHFLLIQNSLLQNPIYHTPTKHKILQLYYFMHWFQSRSSTGVVWCGSKRASKKKSAQKLYTLWTN